MTEVTLTAEQIRQVIADTQPSEQQTLVILRAYAYHTACEASEYTDVSTLWDLLFDLVHATEAKP